MARPAFALVGRSLAVLLIAVTAIMPVAPAAQAAVDAPQDTPTPVVNDTVDEWALGSGLLYWANTCFGEEIDLPPSTIKRQPVGGGTVRTLETTTVEDCLTYFDSAAADDGIYYYDDAENRLEHIGAGEPYSPTVVVDLPTNNEPISTLKVSGDYAYWAAYSAGKLLRVLRSGGDIETVAEGLTQPTDVLVVGSTVYWTDSTGVWSTVTTCETMPCPKAKYSDYGAAGTTGSGLLYRSVNALNFSLMWVERTDLGGGVTQDKIRRRTCGLIENCSLLGTTTTFHTADQKWVIGPPVTDGTNLFWTERIFSPNPANGQVERKALNTTEADPVGDIVDGETGLKSQLAIANGNLYFATSGSPKPTAAGIYLLPLGASVITRDLAADAVEITQGIQNLANTTALVAKKTTYVRAYGTQVSGPNANTVDAQLVGEQGGQPLPGSPLKPLNGTRGLRVGGTYDRARLNDGWLFLLPASWTQGSVTLRVVVDPRQTYSDPAPANNTTERTVTFQNQPPVCVWTVPVRTHTPLPSIYDPNFNAMVSGFAQRWPVPDVWIYRDTDPVEELQLCWSWGIPYPCYGPYELEDGWGLTNGIPDRDKVLASLWTRALLTFNPDACDDIGAPVHFMGMVHPDANNGGASGYASTVSNQSWVQLPDHTPNPLPSDWYTPFAAGVMAQELAHNHGRKHVNCGNPSGIDGNYPYPPCQLDNTGADKNYGFDVRTRTPIRPNEAADYMSYASHTWVSDYTWKALLNDFAVTAAGAVQPQTTLAGDVVYVAGFVDDAIPDGALNYAYILPATTVPPQTLAMAQTAQAAQVGHDDEPHAVYKLRLLSPDDTQLHEETLTLTPVDDHSEDSDPSLFSALFPAPAGTVAKVQLLADGVVIDELTPGLGQPTVAIQQPAGGAVIDANLTIKWTSADPDPDDQLHFIVQYSYDGSHWHSLVNDFPSSAAGSNTLSLADLGSLHGSDGQTAVVRVIASDGYHTTIATSPTFSVPNRKPDPYILAPIAGQSFPAGQPVILSGSATDAEDGGLSGAALAWQVDGNAVGTGADLAVDGLVPGAHTATLTATDANSNAASVTVAFQIEPLGIPQTAAPTLDGFCEDDAYTSGITVALAPYDSTSQAHVRLLRTATDVWACFIDLKQGSEDPGAFVGLRVDVNNSRDPLAQPTDAGFFAGEDGSVFTTAGDGSGGFDASGPGGLTAQVGSDTTTWHAELRITGSALGGLDHLVGLKLGHYSVTAVGDDYGWPTAATNTAPNTWALTALGSLPHLILTDPFTATEAGPAFTMDITGTDLVSGTVVFWNDAALTTTYLDDGHLRAEVGANRIGSAGTFTVTTHSPAPANFVSNGLPFVVEAIPPSVNSVSPVSVTAGSPTTTVTVKGANFTADAQVLWNGVPVPTTFTNSGQLTAQLDGALLFNGQIAGIAVRNTTPQARISSSVAFEVTPRNALFLPVTIR